MVELGKISKYRSELMGFAIIIVMLFHVPLSRLDPFFGLRRMGNLGVDIFFFLSGIGLWYSWAKQQDWRRFYLNRALRIYPAWLIVAGYFYISRFHGTTTASYVDLAGDIIVNWDFWLHDELTFWYVPATMMLYLFAPPYMELVRRHPIYRWLVVLPLMWCIIVQYVAPVHQAVGHIEIFWSRVPIFFLGINMGEMVRQKKSLDGQCIWMVWIMFLMSLCTSIWLEQEIHGKFPLFIERMLYIPLTVTTIILLNRVFRRTPQWFNKGVAWFGALSLEAYLIHIEFVLKPLERNTDLGYWMTFLITVAVTMPLAWLLHYLVNNVILKNSFSKQK